MLPPMGSPSETIVWVIAVALAITSVVIIDGNILVSILVGGAVATVVALVGTLVLGKSKSA